MCKETYSWSLVDSHGFKQQIHHQSSFLSEEPLDPFSLVADELSLLANRLRATLVSEVPKLASAAEYFFKMGVGGERFRPTVLLLMATALNVHIPEQIVGDTLAAELRTRQQCIAEITEMIHVASLLHDDVLDDAETRRSISSLNFVMGNKVFNRRETYSWSLVDSHGFKQQIHHQSSFLIEEPLDPFSLVADELSLLANRLRAMLVSEVPKLASAAEYFFKMGVEGKRLRPTVLLLMATALNVHIPEQIVGDTLAAELRTRQQCIAEIAEMIHVASLLHDDVLDDEETRRSINSLNFVMGNKVAVLAGDVLLSRAFVALASLKNTEVVSLLAIVVEHLVTGETMQMTCTSEQRCSMEYHMQKKYYKTASLISNSCKAIALLAGQTTEVATLAFEYGKNLGLAFQLIDDVLDFTGTFASLGKGSLSDIRHGIVTAPILFAIEEFPQLRAVVQQGFDNPENVDIALEYLGKSRGIHRTRELAAKHASLAAAAIDSLPETDDEEVRKSRRALLDLTHRVITRNK
ncbi:solanesyl diphosphate synthase 3, chloroplastic/mitochondrial isoform X3 [Hevea brasiliensis]|uniref:solanesyl diphosphate synthase 3, chloroplastic/mitochondrial isoform X3 n=1 Tax=Hevea brasiliensis TaxID=3981 RepID=UPI0025D25658|nr:solanesyl diphosphate synthase 3, chloroplastic/mitochondrial isoform X3 [Hevea brasiliensis]